MSLFEPFYLREGVVNQVSRSDKWILIYTKESVKPLAVPTRSTFQIPNIGDKVSVEIAEGERWDFIQHRSMSIDPHPAYFPVEGLENNIPTRTGAVIHLILDWLATHHQITSDDIYQKAVGLYPESDPRFIGHGFRTLAKRKIIHPVGYKNSTRESKNHARPLVVWETTRK